MKALVVDDDRTARYLLKRVLMRDFHYTVVEAEDGIEALELLEKQDFSVVLLDVRMPVMDGLETLQHIRESPKHASLPIVMTTAQNEETSVRRAMALGITDYLVKTSDSQRLVARLSRVLGDRQDVRNRSLRRDEHQADESLGAGSIVMIVDGDADFRRFFISLFQAKFLLREAKSAAQALKMLREIVPAIVFVGGDLGMMSRDSFVQKTLEVSRMTTTRFVAVVPAHQVAETKAAGLYDGVVTRSFVPEVFFRQVSRFFAPPTHLRRWLEAHPSFRPTMITATERVFAMMLAEEVSVCTLPADDRSDRAGVSMQIHLPIDQVALTLALNADTTTSRMITTRMGGASGVDVAEKDANAGIFDIVKMIGDRLQHSLAEQGLTAHVGVPTAQSAPRRAHLAEVADDLVLTFAFEKGHSTFTVSLSVEAEPVGT